MRTGWIVAAAGVLAACGQQAETPVELPEPPVADAPVETVETPAEIAKSDMDLDYRALSGYGEEWYLSPGWPGEYPAGFVVLEADVTVQGRAIPNPSSPASIPCALPQYANYQLWNNARVASDKLDFFVATQTFPVTLSQDANIEYVSEEGISTLDLSAGDQLTYLRYLGEGFAIVSWQGQEYDINEAELQEISDIGTLSTLEAEWVRVTCGSGAQAWLLYRETIGHEGIAPSPITGYGEASDIAPEDVDMVRDMADAMAAAYDGVEPDEVEQ